MPAAGGHEQSAGDADDRQRDPENLQHLRADQHRHREQHVRVARDEPGELPARRARQIRGHRQEDRRRPDRIDDRQQRRDGDGPGLQRGDDLVIHGWSAHSSRDRPLPRSSLTAPRRFFESSRCSRRRFARPGRPARLRAPGRGLQQCDQPRARRIAILPCVRCSRLSISSTPPVVIRLPASAIRRSFTLVRERRGADVEAQLHGGRHLVHVLAARPGGADEALVEIALVDERAYRSLRSMRHDSRVRAAHSPPARSRTTPAETPAAPLLFHVLLDVLLPDFRAVDIALRVDRDAFRVARVGRLLVRIGDEILRPCRPSRCRCGCRASSRRGCATPIRTPSRRRRSCRARR